MATTEPPRPQRGATAEERGSDASPQEKQLTEADSWAKKLGSAANPRFLLSQADGYPAGIKQFLQLCLILVYPAWLFFVIVAWPIALLMKAGEWLLYVLFWPVRKIWGDEK